MTKKTFDLEHPIDHNGEKITAVHLRRPKGREVRSLNNGTASAVDRSFALIATLAEIEEAVVDEMDAADIKKIDAWLNSILGE